MLSKIESLRKQPKHIRNRYAFWIALGTTLCIAVVWLTTVPNRFANIQHIQTQQETRGNFARVFSDLKQTISDAVGNFATSTEDAAVPAQEAPVNTIDFSTFFATSSVQKVENQGILEATNTTTATSTNIE